MTITAYEAQTRAEIARLLEGLSPHQKSPARSCITPIECETRQAAQLKKL